MNFEAACDLGLNPALAYLVIASGTLRDLRTSSWSADAIRRHCTMRWCRAKEAIAALEEADLLTRDNTSSASRPRYYLNEPESESLIWLPNSLVTGVNGEQTPVSWLRRAHSIDALRVLVRLYGVNDLLAEGGIPTSVMFGQYECTRIAERGPRVLWGFDHEENLARGVPAFKGITGRKWPTINILIGMGLLYPVPWVFDGPHDQSGEPLFPVAGDPGATVYDAISSYVEGIEDMPSVAAAVGVHDYIIPLEKSYTEPQMVAVYQLRYLPHASYTLGGIKEIHRVCERWTTAYRTLVASTPKMAR